MEKTSKYVKELTLTRVLDAPRERVWKAWTDPKILAAWWVPRGMSAPICELDVRPGGSLLIHLSGYGKVNPVKGIFQEVLEPERLVFTSDGYGSLEESEPLTKSVTTIVLRESDGKTEMTIHSGVLWTTPEAAQYLNGMDATWAQYMENLAKVLR